MSDKIIPFPRRGLNVTYTPEDEIRHDEIVSGIQSAVFMLCDGMQRNTDAGWDHVMDALVNATIMSGLECGLELDDIQDLMQNIHIEKIEYDA